MGRVPRGRGGHVRPGRVRPRPAHRPRPPGRRTGDAGGLPGQHVPLRRRPGRAPVHGLVRVLRTGQQDPHPAHLGTPVDRPPVGNLRRGTRRRPGPLHPHPRGTPALRHGSRLPLRHRRRRSPRPLTGPARLPHGPPGLAPGRHGLPPGGTDGDDVDRPGSARPLDARGRAPAPPGQGRRHGRLADRRPQGRGGGRPARDLRTRFEGPLQHLETTPRHLQPEPPRPVHDRPQRHAFRADLLLAGRRPGRPLVEGRALGGHAPHPGRAGPRGTEISLRRPSHRRHGLLPGLRIPGRVGRPPLAGPADGTPRLPGLAPLVRRRPAE